MLKLNVPPVADQIAPVVAEPPNEPPKAIVVPPCGMAGIAGPILMVGAGVTVFVTTPSLWCRLLKPPFV